MPLRFATIARLGATRSAKSRTVRGLSAELGREGAATVFVVGVIRSAESRTVRGPSADSGGGDAGLLIAGSMGTATPLIVAGVICVFAGGAMAFMSAFESSRYQATPLTQEPPNQPNANNAYN